LALKQKTAYTDSDWLKLKELKRFTAGSLRSDIKKVSVVHNLHKATKKVYGVAETTFMQPSAIT